MWIKYATLSAGAFVINTTRITHIRKGKSIRIWTLDGDGNTGQDFYEIKFENEESLEVGWKCLMEALK